MKRPIIFLSSIIVALASMAQQTLFPAEHIAPSKFNTGTVHLSVLSKSERQMTTNFLFEAGSRNSWHFHPGATQVLMVLDGEGYYQEEGKAKQLIRKGDVIVTAPNTRHWNGATPYSSVECMTVSDIAKGEDHAVQLHKVTDEEFASPVDSSGDMIVRIAEIEVHEQYLDQYLQAAATVGGISVQKEPGVVCIFPMQVKEQPNLIRIVEIYRDQAAYETHLATDHFKQYKQGTLHMVKSLRLVDATPLDPAAMINIFVKK